MKTIAAKAFTLVEIMIVVAVIGIIIAIAVPSYMRARENARGRACQENLAKIDGAKMQYALDKKPNPGDEISGDALWNDDGTGYLRAEPTCPSDGDQYIIGDFTVDPTCPNFDPDAVYVKHQTRGTL